MLSRFQCHGKFKKLRKYSECSIVVVHEKDTDYVHDRFSLSLFLSFVFYYYFLFFIQQLDCKCPYAKKSSLLRICSVSTTLNLYSQSFLEEKTKQNQHSSIAFDSTEMEEEEQDETDFNFHDS